MRLNAAVVVLLTGLVAATYGFGIYLFAQLVPDMQASLGFSFAYVGTITAAGQLGFLLCALLAAWLTWVLLSFLRAAWHRLSRLFSASEKVA